MRLIENSDIILDGTLSRAEKEKQAFKKLEEIENLLLKYRIDSNKDLEKILKAFNILVKKRVDIGWLIRSENCSKYNLGVGGQQALKKQEYDLLKEVLL